MTRLESLCAAIQKNEGWYPLSRSWRNNNPGNLRSSPFASSARGGFAQFANYASGWLALWWDVWMKCQGRTRTGLTPNSTLLDLATAWAPASDGNHPAAYAAKLAAQLQISIYTRLEYFLYDAPKT